MVSIKKIELEAFADGELEEKIKEYLNIIFSGGLNVLYIRRYTTPSTFYNASTIYAVKEKDIMEVKGNGIVGFTM